MKAEGRVRVKLLVSLQPGLHLRELQRQAGLSFSSTRYHIDKLAKDGEIDRVEDNGYSRIYPAGFDHKDRVLFSLVRRETDRRILSSFLRENSVSQERLTDLTKLAKSTVSEHLATLLKLGVVKTNAEGERRIFELTDPAKIDTMLNRYPHLLSKATRRFIDLWDF